MKFNEDVIIFDTETTGIDFLNDEILQLSIINGKGKVLFNHYFKPQNIRSWPKTQSIHGITPADVKYMRSIRFYKEQIQEIFESAQTIIAYNSNFDITFLKNQNIDCFKMSSKQLELFTDLPPRQKNLKDPMIDFSQIFGEWDEYYGQYKWQKLATAAKYYGYEFKAHDFLEDVKATLYISKKIYGEY